MYTSLRMYPSRALGRLEDYALTAYLFTKSDIKTILLPVTICSAQIAPLYSYSRLLISILWIWLHLLFFCMSNQCAGVVEDAINKPWRPIPAGRMTLARASSSRWFLVPLCLTLSLLNGALWPSAVLLVATWGYNDLGYHGHWLGKNVVNVVGYLAFEFGATAVSEKDHVVHRSAMQSLLVIGLIILTTVHAGDFPDIVGDRKLGRRTVPIVFPKIARPGLSASLGIWSLLGSISSWHASSTTSIGALSGLFVAWRFFVFRTTVDDETSCFLYNIWLSGMHLVFAVTFMR